MSAGVAGHNAGVGVPVAVQLMTAQLPKPALATSRTAELLAALGPELTKVTVYVVVLPAETVVVPSLLVTLRFARRAKSVFSKAQPPKVGKPEK